LFSLIFIAAPKSRKTSVEFFFDGIEADPSLNEAALRQLEDRDAVRGDVLA
jgi:hypothetical protein